MPNENDHVSELGVDWYFNQYRDRKFLSSRMCSLLAYTANMLNNKDAGKRELFLEVLYRLRPVAIYDFTGHAHPAVVATMKPLLRSPKTWTIADLTLFKGAYLALSHNAVMPATKNYAIEIKPVTSEHTKVKHAPVEQNPADREPLSRAKSASNARRKAVRPPRPKA